MRRRRLTLLVTSVSLPRGGGELPETDLALIGGRCQVSPMRSIRGHSAHFCTGIFSQRILEQNLAPSGGSQSKGVGAWWARGIPLAAEGCDLLLSEGPSEAQSLLLRTGAARPICQENSWEQDSPRQREGPEVGDSVTLTMCFPQEWMCTQAFARTRRGCHRLPGRSPA